MNPKKYVYLCCDPKLLLSILFVWIVSAFVVIVLIDEINSSKREYEESLKKSLIQEAAAHYDNIVTARRWNALHGGIYILQHDAIEPNKYLKNNTLKSDDNRTLIKVNPAWMTRQMSDLSNKSSKHYYKMTSLNPINPINKADAFEKKALEYLEKNKNEPYYFSFIEPVKGIRKFDFMGSLKVTKECLSCHTEQGYRLDDIRGGIRVSLPLDNYTNSYNHLQDKSLFDKSLIIIFGIIMASLVSVYLRKTFRYQQEIEKLNKELEDKVQQRTHELNEINLNLKDKVAAELEKNRKKDEAMLMQARYIAMGEMLQVIAHQWRQPISIIGLDANNLLIDFELETDNKESIKIGLENISNETQKLSKIITDVTELFNSDASTHKVLPQSVADDALSIMQSNFDENVIITEKNYTNLSETELIPKELFQVYWNVLNNAQDILIQRDVSNPKITIDVFENEDEILTNISDNGGGIEDEYLEKIFEPYFSTSSNLYGKGLGLYMAKIIIEKHLNGSIGVKNSDVGAVFTISIPK